LVISKGIFSCYNWEGWKEEKEDTIGICWALSPNKELSGQNGAKVEEPVIQCKGC
jgi:hypothetical protein